VSITNPNGDELGQYLVQCKRCSAWYRRRELRYLHIPHVPGSPLSRHLVCATCWRPPHPHDDPPPVVVIIDPIET
jgi:hypothetical protein